MQNAVVMAAVCTSLLLGTPTPTAATDECSNATACQEWIYPEKIYIILCTCLGGVVLFTAVVGCVAVGKYTQLTRLLESQRQNGTGADPEDAAPTQSSSAPTSERQTRPKKRRNKSAKASARSTQSSSSVVSNTASSRGAYELAMAPTIGQSRERFHFTSSPAHSYPDPSTEYQDPLDASGTFPSPRSNARSSLLGRKTDRANTSSSQVVYKAGDSSGAYELATGPNIGQSGENFQLTSSPVRGYQGPSTEYQDPLDVAGKFPSVHAANASSPSGQRQDSYSNVDLRRKSVSKKDRAGALPACEEFEEAPEVPVKSSNCAVLSAGAQDASTISDQPGAPYSQVELKRKPHAAKATRGHEEELDEEEPEIPKKMDGISELANTSAPQQPSVATPTSEQGADGLHSHAANSRVCYENVPHLLDDVRDDDAVQESSFMGGYRGELHGVAEP